MTSKHKQMEGHGFVTYWGFSPCLDLQNEVQPVVKTSDEAQTLDDLNVLLMGSGDIRHIFKTIAHARRHPFRRVNLYIIEGSLESLARHMLFLKLITEPVNAIGMQERSEMFLEVFGNTFLRPLTAAYVAKAATEFILMVTNIAFQETKLPFLDLINLRFKERDAMESIFKIWKKQKELNFSTCWDIRLHRHLDQQYDSREGAFDWDYHMKLADRGGDIINQMEYKKWRRTGMAFELRDADYTTSNYTLLSPIVINDLLGDKHVRLGYWGDVVIGPYISFGIETEDESLLKRENKQYVKKSQEISQQNIMALFHELYSGRKSQKDGGESIVNIINNYTKLIFLPTAWASKVQTKSKFQRLFNLVFFSNSMNHFFTPDITATFQDGATVIMETAKFLLDLKNENIQSFREDILKLAVTASCKPLQSKPEDVYLRFIYEKFPERKQKTRH